MHIFEIVPPIFGRVAYLSLSWADTAECRPNVREVPEGVNALWRESAATC